MCLSGHGILSAPDGAPHPCCRNGDRPGDTRSLLGLCSVTTALPPENKQRVGDTPAGRLWGRCVATRHREKRAASTPRRVARRVSDRLLSSCKERRRPGEAAGQYTAKIAT